MIEIKPPQGSRKRKHIVGRGHGSGWRKTAKRGARGQTATTSGTVKIGFEGGQMPLYRRIPRRGFNNKRFASSVARINLWQVEKYYQQGEVVNYQTLLDKGLIKKDVDRVKLLGNGELTKKVDLCIDCYSKSVEEKYSEWIVKS